VLTALDREDLASDERFADGRALRKHKRAVIAVLDEEFSRRDLDEWARRLDDAGVWWAPVSSPADVLRDPQVLANEGLVEVPNPGGAGTTSSVNGPVSFRGRPLRRTGPAPRLGEHPDAHF